MPKLGSDPPGAHLPLPGLQVPICMMGCTWHSGRAAPTPSNLPALLPGAGHSTRLWAQAWLAGFVALPARALRRAGRRVPCRLPAVHLVCIHRSSADALPHSSRSRMIRTGTWCGRGLAFKLQSHKPQGVLMQTDLQTQARDTGC